MSLFFLTIALILGLTLTRGNLAFSIPFSVIYLLFLLYRLGLKKTGIALLLFSIGLGASFIVIKANPTDGFYNGVVVDARENYYIFESKFEKFYVYDRKNNKECGDILSLSGTVNDINFTTYESQFDFNEYLINKGVHREINVKREIVKFLNPIRISQRKNQFLNSFDYETSSMIDSFLFNRKDYKSQGIILADSLNIISLLSMSGIYLHFILNVFEFILKRVFKEKTANLITTLFVLPYALFSITKFGVIRVLFMRVLNFINKYLLNGKYNYIELISGSMLFFIIMDFHLIYQESFYLGYLISFMLIYIRYYSKKVNRRIRPLIILLSINIFMLPFSLRNTNELHLFTPLFQVILLPIHESYSLLSLLSLYITPFKNIMRIFTRLILTFYKDLSYIDISITAGEYLPFLFIVFYFGYFFSLLFYECKMRKFMFISLGVMIFTICISIIPIRPILRNAVYFLNVGQGDSIIIQNRMHAVMIDTGGNKSFDMAKETLIPFMKKKQIYKLDALITTHDDFDHNGAANSLINNYHVDNYFTHDKNFSYSAGSITLTNINDYESSEDNDLSMVLTLDFMGKKWLFTGDASIDVEKFLIDKNIDIDCDILKIGHHGSKTSTCEEFLKATTPEQAIISVGANNYYKHPNDEVIDRLNKYNIRIRRTDLEGTISFVEFAH